MNAKTNYILVGLFVLGLGAAFIGVLLWLSAGGPGKHYDKYIVYMTESVSGLSKDAGVKYRGVDVGRVRDISLDPTNPERVRLLLDIEEGTPIKVDTVATLETQGLTGLASINLSGGSKDALPLRASKDGQYPVIPSRPSLLGRLDQSVSKLIENLIETSNRLNHLLDHGNQDAVSNTLKHFETISAHLADNMNTVSTAMNDFAATMRNVRQASGDLPKLVKQARDGAAAMKHMADELAATGVALRKRVDAGGKDMQRFASQTLPQAQAMVEELRLAAENLRRMSEQLQRNPSVLIYGAPKPAPGPGE
jgi:phospholipid/cholesterol/gamma-HCH transport system substrate-binding protein